MAEVLNPGLLKTERRPILDAARNRRWEEVGKLLDGVSDAVALTRFKTFAEMNWASDLRGDTRTLTDAVSKRIAAIGGVEVGNVATAPTQGVDAPVKPVVPVAPEVRGPAQGAQPKADVPQAPARPPKVTPPPTRGPAPGARPKTEVHTPPVYTSREGRR